MIRYTVFRADAIEQKVAEKEMATNEDGSGLFDNTHGDMKQWLGNCQFHARDFNSLIRQLNVNYGYPGGVRWFKTEAGARRWLKKEA